MRKAGSLTRRDLLDADGERELRVLEALELRGREPVARHGAAAGVEHEHDLGCKASSRCHLYCGKPNVDQLLISKNASNLNEYVLAKSASIQSIMTPLKFATRAMHLPENR